MEAVDRGEIEHGTEAANQYWRDVPVRLEAGDAQEVPDWITKINMLATLAAIALAIWACCASGRERDTIVGLSKFLGFLVFEFLVFLMYGRAVSGARPQTAFTHFVLNPVMDTMVLTGGGSVVLYALNPGSGYAILAFVIMFICNAYAVFSGRILLNSKLRAGVVFLTVYAIVAWLYFRV